MPAPREATYTLVGMAAGVTPGASRDVTVISIRDRQRQVTIHDRSRTVGITAHQRTVTIVDRSDQ